MGKTPICQEIFSKIPYDANRVAATFSKVPECACEGSKVSPHSPSPVANTETITRFVRSPMHTNKSGDLMPNFFSHAETKGLSAQREELTRGSEIAALLEGFLGSDEKAAWLGYVECKVSAVRAAAFEGGERAVCVYDTALLDNHAHVEMFQSRHRIEEADGPELRNLLYRIFGDGSIQKPENYRSGVTWNSLKDAYRARTVDHRTQYAARKSKRK